MADRADLVLRGGRVWAGLGAPPATAIAISNGRVLAVGSDNDVSNLIGPATRVVELRGRLAVPGLEDAHLHVPHIGLGMVEVDASPEAAPTLRALLDAIAARARSQPPGTWVQARGYDHGRLDVGRHPTRVELDQAAPNNPVHLVRTCGHLSVANSAAFALAGVTAATPSPPGGLIEVRDGELTGLMAESGRDAVRDVIPPPTRDELVDAIERAGRHCLERGVTSVMDAAIGLRGGFAEMEAYLAARDGGRLPIRVYGCLLGDPETSIVEACLEAGLTPGAGDDRFRVGPVKIFTDGAAGGRTAAMFEPYLGVPETRGLLSWPEAVVRDLVRRYHGLGFQLAIHAIGDEAIEQTLSAIEAALREQPAPDRRHRIEHCGYATPGQLQRMRAAGIYPAPQPVFLRDFGDLYVKVLGAERTDAAYPLKTFFDLGFRPSASTDAPVCRVDPLANLHAMVTRRARSGRVMAPQERVSLEEALCTYTENAAFAARAEGERGRLAPRLSGDVTVFSADLFALEPDAWLDERCDLAILRGEVAFDRESAS